MDSEWSCLKTIGPEVNNGVFFERIPQEDCPVLCGNQSSLEVVVVHGKFFDVSLLMKHNRYGESGD